MSQLIALILLALSAVTFSPADEGTFNPSATLDTSQVEVAP